MQGKLFLEFEKVLDEEAKRIVTEIMYKYERKEKVNKSFRQMVMSLIKPELEYYTTDIELRCYGLLPRELVYDDKNEYALITREEAIENHLLSYSECARKRNLDKNHIQAAKELADLIITFCNENPTTDIGLPQIVADNMDALFPEHNDSVDSRATVLFLQSELEAKGYVITSLVPIRILNR